MAKDRKQRVTKSKKKNEKESQSNWRCCPSAIGLRNSSLFLSRSSHFFTALNTSLSFTKSRDPQWSYLPFWRSSPCGSLGSYVDMPTAKHGGRRKNCSLKLGRIITLEKEVKLQIATSVCSGLAFQKEMKSNGGFAWSLPSKKKWLVLMKGTFRSTRSWAESVDSGLGSQHRTGFGAFCPW